MFHSCWIEPTCPSGRINVTEGKDRRFQTTRWSMIVRAGHDNVSGEARRDALENICQTYWFPAYSYVRSRGYSQQDAQDLTQDFFARLLENDFFDVVDQERGKFRSFLLIALRRFLADEWDKTQAQKRGGGIRHQSLSLDTAELLIAESAQKPLTPDQIFDLHWAKTILANALRRVEQEHMDSGKEQSFRVLRPFLGSRDPDHRYSDAAQELGISDGGVKAAIHRLRARYRQALEVEVSETLMDGEDLSEELKYLLARLTA
jgi:RNA polymerase sigma-70 factor (ECF subfamily)